MRIEQIFTSPGHNYYGHHDQPPDDFRGFGFGRIQRKAALIAIQREESATFAAIGDRTRVAVFTALSAVDADYIRAHVSQQHATVRAGDESSEIDHTNTREWAGSWHSLILCTAGG